MLVVPTLPCGSTDFAARVMAEPFTRALGQSVIVDNKPAAPAGTSVEAFTPAQLGEFTRKALDDWGE